MAPPPYDGAFQVLYDPDDPTDPDTIMTVNDVEDEVLPGRPARDWVVVGAVLTFGLGLIRPAVRSTVEANHRFGAARRTIDAHLDLLHGSADDDVLRVPVHDAVDGASDRSRVRLRRERIRVLVMAVGIVLMAVSVLTWATTGREAVIAYHLRDAGIETKDDRTVSTKGVRGGPGHRRHGRVPRCRARRAGPVHRRAVRTRLVLERRASPGRFRRRPGS